MVTLERMTQCTWKDMKRRCLDQEYTGYKRYGGRGITVCDRWMDFKNFVEDMGIKPAANMTIEREDNDKGYCKSNCRWIPKSEQSRHRSTVRYYTFNGKTLCLAEWARELGIKRLTLKRRLDKQKLSVEEAFTMPVTISGKDVLITFEGRTETIKEWSRIKGMGDAILRFRLKNGWSVQDALNTTVRPMSTRRAKKTCSQGT